MPSRWILHLTGSSEVALPVAAPHAVLSRWLDVDHAARVKGYALTPPQPAAGGLRWEVRLLDDDLEDRLRAATTIGTPVRLGRHHFIVSQPPECMERQTFKELSAPSTTRAWQLSFVTPTTFRKRDRSTPLPTPESLVRGLADRWAFLDPGTAPEVTVTDATALWVSDLEGHSVTLTLQGRIVSGFVGRVRIVINPGAEHQNVAQATDSLVRFAGFAGAGSFTAHGLGVVVQAPTWQPRHPS